MVSSIANANMSIITTRADPELSILNYLQIKNRSNKERFFIHTFKNQKIILQKEPML